MVLQLALAQGERILDVGCGEGRFLRPLAAAGLQVVGLDLNQTLVANLRSADHEVYEPHEFLARDSWIFDAVLMSHVLEHMYPADMLASVDNYLDYLKVGGSLIVATPLMWDQFYDDYDHIRPYPPKSLEFLFSDYAQLQQKPRNRLRLDWVWFRRGPYEWRWYPGQSRATSRKNHLLNRIAARAFSMSRAAIGRKTGWVGRLIKIA